MITKKDLKRTNILARRKNKDKKEEQKKDQTKQKFLWITDKQRFNMPTRVISVETITENKEKFTLKNENTILDLTYDITQNPKLFEFLMDCFRDNKVLDISEIGELIKDDKKN